MTTSPRTDPKRPFDGTRPAAAVFKDFLDTIDDTIKHSGTSFPGWNRNRLAGYHAQACAVRSQEDGRVYTIWGEGAGVPDPQASIEAMKKHWESLGYTIGNIFDQMGGNTTGKQINASTPNGFSLQFTPGKTRTSISVQSDCTLDPLARQTTTDTIPLGTPTPPSGA